MPVLSIDYSKGASSAILINDDLSYKTARISILIPEIFYATKPSPTELFELLIKSFEEKFGVNIPTSTLTYAASLKPLYVERSNSKFCLKNEAFKFLQPIDFMYFSHLHVGSGEGIFYLDVDFKKLLSDIFFDEKEATLRNYFQNLNLYPYLEPSSDRDFYEEHAYLKAIAERSCQISTNILQAATKSIIFSTTRNLTDDKALARFALLCIDSLCLEGFYQLKFDLNDFLGSIAPLALFDNALYQQIEQPEFTAVGTVVNLSDDLTCKISGLGGLVNEFKIAKNQIFAFPLPKNEKAHITIKSKKYGELENDLTGGLFGVILDTREKIDGKVLQSDERKALIKTWEENLIRDIKGI